MYCCSVTLISLWRIITESSSEGCLILCVCRCLCHRQRPWNSDMASPVPRSSVSARHARSSEMESESPRMTRRAHCRMRPTHVRNEPVGVKFPTLTVQDIPDLTGAIIYDCHPPLLPVLLRLQDIRLSPRTGPVDSASLAAPPTEDSMVIGGANPERVAIPELGVAPHTWNVFGSCVMSCWTYHHCPPTYHLSQTLLRLFRCLRRCIGRHLLLLNRTLSPVSSRRMFRSGRRTNVRRLTCFRHFWSLPLSPTMIQPHSRLLRTSWMILDYCRRTVRLLWTSTFADIPDGGRIV